MTPLYGGTACLLTLIFTIGCTRAQQVDHTTAVSSSASNTKAMETAPIRITFDLLKHEERTRVPPTSRTIPEEIRKLNGQTVVLDGFCNPMVIEKRMFVLEITNILPADERPIRYADESVAVTLTEDWTGSTPIGKIEVTGTFRIEDTYDEASREVFLIYYLDNATIKKRPFVMD
ncbi:MAG: hypothetical protein JNM18_06550 [Planctomycetaceae bacterium]|nr:hypothetical protein [Planctomycetaceae bacterium]